MVEWLKNFLYPGGTFVDVGAHIGYFTLIAADIVGPKGRVIAFEPDPRNASILTANVNSAGKDDMVKIVRAAVGAKSGTILFQRSDPDYRSQIAAEGGCSETIVVVQCTLNEFDLPQGTVIKVDVEGAEVDVLQGATNYLESKKTTWIIETHGPELEQTVLTILRQYGYYPEVHAPVHPAYADYRQRYVLAIGL
jgi:FkbM family methyltransferase